MLAQQYEAFPRVVSSRRYVPAPGTINTYANGISGNIVVGDYQDGSGYHGFIYDGTSYTTFDYPDASGTYIQGITENNIVGYYGAAHGFIVTPIPVPSPPTAKCQNVTVVAGPSCTAPASIDNGSYENGSPVTLTQTPAGPYSLGTTPVTLTVTDGKGASNQCTGTVTVQDKTPPAITMASVNPSVLWPPNHKMVDVMVNYTSTDNCSSQPTCTISGVTSNEPISSSDYSIVGAHHVELSADRLGGGNGRIYTIPIACTDASGNLSTQTMAVSVPHDQGKK